MNYSQFGFRKDFDINNRIVKQENIKQNGKEYFVSTVDLGLNHRFGEGKPLYFETMIFEGKDSRDLYCNRYTTREEALKEHEQLVQKILKNEFIIENEQQG